MTESTLRGHKILIVEDEYLLAEDLRAALASKYAVVVGPAPTVEKGFTLLRENEKLDCAILDINLRGEPVFSVADELVARGIPFVFTTGYDSSSIPDRFEHVTRCEKPVTLDDVISTIGLMVQGRR